MDFGGWQGGSLIGRVIQLVCSSWAKKMILRLKSGGMGLFNDLFVCIVNWRVLCHYMLDGALYVAGS